jgi:hypothetical protein
MAVLLSDYRAQTATVASCTEESKRNECIPPPVGVPNIERGEELVTDLHNKKVLVELARTTRKITHRILTIATVHA